MGRMVGWAPTYGSAFGSWHQRRTLPVLLIDTHRPLNTVQRTREQMDMLCLPTTNALPMCSIELLPIAVPFKDDAMKVTGVHWRDDAPTTISVLSRRSGRRVKVEFQDAAGIRILGELDLAGLWLGSDPATLKATWLYEVRAGGWFNLESQRDDFHTKHEAPTREFLIAGYQECVSVFSNLGPLFVELGEATDG